MITLKAKGVCFNLHQNSLVGKVTRHVDRLTESSFLILEQPSNIKIPAKCAGILTSLSIEEVHTELPMISNIDSLAHLSDGDIVAIHSDGIIRTLYRFGSPHNSLLVTERCNSNCLMCSQPPKDKNDVEFLFDMHQQLIPLIPKNTEVLGITGGEPTLLGNRFFEMLALCKEHLPDTEIHVLSNGRSFAWTAMAERLASINHDKVIIGIPVYSDYYQVHDYVVQAPNAFYQTIQGLHNLARYGQRVEIRIVLQKPVIPRLVKLAHYIYKNLPFVEHVAFMGLEYIGYAPHNIEKIWIDPFDYQAELTEAIEYLAGYGFNVSIYNLQHCILPKNLWQYTRKSISDWKNDYADECKACSQLDACGGFFTWNLNKKSKHIQAIV